jgi:hypothetical protein
MIQGVDGNEARSLRHPEEGPEEGKLREVASSKLSRQIKLLEGISFPQYSN